MTIGSFRQDYEAQLAGRAALRGGEAPKPPTTMSAEAAAHDDVASRIRAIELTTAKGQPPGLPIEQVIARLADAGENPSVRLAALIKLKELEFFGSVLDPYRPDYLEALKKAAKSGVADLVHGALEVLAGHKEPFARETLLAFLRDPKSAIISLAQVVQLLSYDDHSDVISAVRSLIEKAKDKDVIEEGIRLLSSDPGSEGLFTRLLRDKTQPKDVRRWSANGLHSINPTLFATIASKIVDDDEEDDDLRATCLSTLTHFSDYAKERLDKTLTDKVKQLVDRSPSINLKATASRFLERLKQDKK